MMVFTFEVGEKKMKYYTYYNSPLGVIVLISDGKHLINLEFERQKYISNIDDLENKDELEIFKKVKTWLDEYFDGKNPSIKSIPLKLEGSKFQKLVYRELLKIPYGEVTTYGEIAKRVASIMGKEKMSAQAVGGAVGHNQIAIIVPCHRVVGKNGNLVGYSGGLEKKIRLLELENKKRCLETRGC